MKTIYRPDTAAEFFQHLCKTRSTDDTSPVFSGTLRIEPGRATFVGNADISHLRLSDILAEAAKQLHLAGIQIEWPPVLRGQPTAYAPTFNQQ